MYQIDQIINVFRLKKKRAKRFKKGKSIGLNLLYVVTSISSGISVIWTSKRFCTSLRIAASFSSATYVIAKPFVPNRPARATYTKPKFDRFSSRFSLIWTYSMEIRVRIFGHIVIEDDIHTFDVHATAEQIRCDENSSLKFFEFLVPSQTIFLRHATMNFDGRKILID